MEPVKIRARFNCSRTNGITIEQGNSPTFRLRGMLVEFSDRPLAFRHTCAPVQQRFSKIGTEYDEDLMKQAGSGLEVLQEIEQLPTELVQIESVFVVDGTIGVGAHYAQFDECVG